MRPVSLIEGGVSVLDRSDVDTDQIIPKQFLKRVERTGFGEFLFYDWAKQPGWELPRNPILAAGRNFGCGSSREHAPWALQGYGFKAVISPGFADIFRGNSLKIGLLPIAVDEETYHELLSHIEEDPETAVTVDLENQRVVLPGGRAVSFPIDGFAKHCLVNGVDQLGFLQQQADAVAAFEAAAPATLNTKAQR